MTEGHLSQLHLGPRVVQYLPAPLERAEERLALQLGVGAHIQPGTHSTTRSLVLTALQHGPQCYFTERGTSFTVEIFIGIRTLHSNVQPVCKGNDFQRIETLIHPKSSKRVIAFLLVTT